MALASRSDERPLIYLGETGYSLVEMTIATAVAVVVGLGIYAIFNSQRRVAESQKIYNDLQSSCGFAMDQIKRELPLAGYRAVLNSTSPVSDAGGDTITFEYWDEQAPYDDTFPEKYPSGKQKHDRHTQVFYKLEADGDLVRKFKRGILNNNAANEFREYADNHDNGTIDFTDPAFPPELTQTLAKNVESFSLQYFSDNNGTLSWNSWLPENSTISENKLSRIRSVVVSLQCRAAKANPIYTGVSKYPVIRLQSEVRLRNIGVAVNPRDTQPPAKPTHLRVWDPGLCALPDTVCAPPTAPACAPLQLAWDANTESDLAGYILYYGLATGSYSNRVRIARGPGAAGTRVGYTLTGLEPTTTCSLTPTTYFFKIEAFDKSGNPSPRSDEISGPTVPGTNLRSEAEAIAADDNDTTINPTAPPAPSDFVAGTPADNRIQLSWAAPPDTAGVVGYRLYRGAAAGFTPAGRRVGDSGSNILADETTLTADRFAYTDSGLTGCVPVFYKLAAITCDPCLPVGGLAFATAAGSPTDGKQPSPPKLVARPGFQRVILSLENPVLADEPDFKETRIYFNAVSGECTSSTYPSIATDGTVSNGVLIPDSGGVFTGAGTLESINFDDVAVETPPKPNLDINSTYCFLAVAYDQCNNHSDATDKAKAEGQQCGDCMTTDDPPKPDTCYGAPPAPLVSKIMTAGCYGSLEFTWDHADPTGITIRDFTGYRVYRCENVSASPCSSTSTLWLDPQWVLLTGADPVWFSKFVDTPDKGLQEGHKYSYRILATDCYWEQHHGKPSSQWPDPANDPNDNAADSALPKPLSVGRIVRDPSLRQVLSGMMPDTAADWTLYASVPEFRISPAFRHNTVLFRLRNTVDATLSLKQAAIGWESAAAFLQRIAYGDNNTTPITSEAWLDTASPLTRSSGGAVAFNAGAEFYPLDDAIPVHLTFKRDTGVVDDTVNLRENQMSIGISYRNESTGDESCSMQENIYVPLGPYIYGTTQDLPSAGTMAWPVPGAGGINAINGILVPGEQMVNVYTNISDSDFAGIREARLYWYADATKAGSAPALDADPRYDQNPLADDLSPYQRIELERVAGNQWRTPADHGIPASNDANVWFFIAAVDNNGNFDREPEPGSGAFQYYQQPYNVCQNRPEAPVLTGEHTSTTVSLSWTAPQNNTDGTSLTDLSASKGFSVYRKPLTGGPVRLVTLSSDTFTYLDTPPDMSVQTYTYYVTASDTCENPGPNESAPSNWYTECEGAAGCTLQLITTQQAPTYFRAGDSFAVNLFICGKIDGVSDHKLFAQVCSGADSSVVRLTESGDSGMFTLDPSAPQQSGTTIVTWLTKPGDADKLDLLVGATDTVGVYAWDENSPTGGCGSLSNCSASIQVQTNPCEVRPGTPTNFTITQIGSCESGKDAPTPTNTSEVQLSWTASSGPVSYYNIHFCADSGCTLVQTKRTAGTETTFVYDVGAQLKNKEYRFAVSAVNDACAAPNTNREGPLSDAVSDPCQ